MNCPKCKTALRQLGHTEDNKSGQRIWVGENLWNCPNCRWPDDLKTYTVVNGKLEPVKS